ncbi:pilus assembly protein [Cupriavidus pauculus]|uniref:Pilus assembly protein n=1 Tax=Cupriavidus pauculus TaxID=82633 RepID=A0A3G8H4C5_9BURK|nr:pilus assembly protein [Cupriavidus pauculus]
MPGNPATGPAGGAPQRPNVLSLSIKDQAGLYAAYMPFLARGGIFVPSNRPFRLGEQVFLVLSLLDRPQKYQVQGTVAWITPAGTPMKTPGVGVHLPDDENGRVLRRAVEELLGKAIESGRPTQTL